MSRRAAEQMSKALEEKLSGATLVRISTTGAFSDGSYMLTSNIVYLGKIGKDHRFEVVAN